MPYRSGSQTSPPSGSGSFEDELAGTSAEELDVTFSCELIGRIPLVMISGGMDELLGVSEELDFTSSCELIGRMPLVMISGGMDELLGVSEELLEGTYVSLDEWGMPEVRELDLGGTTEELDSMGGMSSPEVISRESIFTEEEDCSVTEELDSAPGSATSPLVCPGSLGLIRGSSMPLAETPSVSHAESETSAEMPRTAASPVFVAADHSRFFSTLHFLMFIIHSSFSTNIV